MYNYQLFTKVNLKFIQYFKLKQTNYWNTQFFGHFEFKVDKLCRLVFIFLLYLQQRLLQGKNNSVNFPYSLNETINYGISFCSHSRLYKALTMPIGLKVHDESLAILDR